MNNQIFNRRVAEQFKNIRLLWDELFFPFRNKKYSPTTRSEDDVVEVCRNLPKSPISLKEVPRNNSSYPEKEFRRKPKNQRFLRIVHFVFQIFMWVRPLWFRKIQKVQRWIREFSEASSTSRKDSPIFCQIILDYISAFMSSLNPRRT